MPISCHPFVTKEPQQRSIDGYCRGMEHRFGVTPNPEQNIVTLYGGGRQLGQGTILSPEGFILSTAPIVRSVNDHISEGIEAYAQAIDGTKIAFDLDFHRYNTELGIIKAKGSIEKIGRVGLESHFKHHIFEGRSIVPGDYELNNLYWNKVRSCAGRIAFPHESVTSDFHVFTSDSPTFTYSKDICLGAEVVSEETAIHQIGNRHFLLDNTGPVEPQPKQGVYSGSFHTSLIVNEGDIGSGVYVRDETDYDREQQPKLFLVGVVAQSSSMENYGSSRYQIPICEVARVRIKEIKELLRPTKP